MTTKSLSETLSELSELPDESKVGTLAAATRHWLTGGFPAISDDERKQIISALVAAIESGTGPGPDRLAIGAVLGHLGDPRLRTPDDAAYWSEVNLPEGMVLMGRHLVTNHEFQRFVDSGAYDNADVWAGIDGAQEWLSSTEQRWPDLAAQDDSGPLIVANQPVVGVSWFEAVAYARWAGARLPEFEERLQVTRGAEKRPYPWGAPFGEGNANTQEEVLLQPTAVGLYVNDKTPEGIFDLAGNVAEWCGDGVDQDRWVHPGAWDQPSMSSWAKARVLESPTSRGTGLGFRLARSAS